MELGKGLSVGVGCRDERWGREPGKICEMDVVPQQRDETCRLVVGGGNGRK